MGVCIRRWFAIGVGVLALFPIGCDKKSATSEDALPPPKLHSAFQVAKLTGTGKTVQMGPWQQSTDVLPKERVTVMVIASWCPYCNQALKALETDDSALRSVDMFVLYEDETNKAIDRSVSEKETDPSEALQMKKVAASRNLFLTAPDAITKYKYPFYAVKSEQFDSIVKAYPTMIVCSATGCTAAEGKRK